MNRKITIAFDFLLLGFFFFAASLWAEVSVPAPLTIDEAGVTIRVDGRLSDWPSARMLVLDQQKQITSGNTFWKGADDFSGRIFLTYDDQFLYLAAVVRKGKKKVVNDNDPLSLANGDCLELYLATDPNYGQEMDLSPGDYHLAFSPGTGCKNPQMYCLDKNKPIPGGRVVARSTLDGYILEACVPLTFLEGLKLSKGNKAAFNIALDEGGEVSGYRIVRMDLDGPGFREENPSTWIPLQWIGNIVETIPFQQSHDLYADLVSDGTQGATYAGNRTIAGRALDPQGKALTGVKITTWPKTADVTTDPQGNFVMPKGKIYSQTMIYGRKDGFIPSVASLGVKGKAVTLHLDPLPSELRAPQGRVSPFFFGLVLPGTSPARFDAFVLAAKDSIPSLKPGMLRLTFPAGGISVEDSRSLMDKFLNYARDLGAEPMLTVPLDPQIAVQWLAYTKTSEDRKVRYWAIGDKPDAPGSNLTAYDYLNRFRSVYDAMKAVDPSIFVLGPETGSNFGQGDSDWVSPLILYDGDILNGVSIQHYGFFDPASLTQRLVSENIRHMRGLLGALNEKVSQSSDFYVPVIISGGGASSRVIEGKTKEDGLEREFWASLWEAEQRGICLKEGFPMDLSSVTWIEPSGSQPDAVVNPSYWSLRLWSLMDRGKIVTVQVQKSDISVCATQDPKTKDVTLMIINESDNYWRPKILLNGQISDLTLDAGLNFKYDYEVPSYSINLLTFKADGSVGEAKAYTLKLARAGKAPQSFKLMPW